MNKKRKKHKQFLRKVDAEVRANIEKWGWHITGIGGSDEFPPFTYSTGLSEYNLHELIIVGLPLEVCASFINRIGNEMMDGMQFDLNTRYYGYCGGQTDYPMKLIEVSAKAKDKLMTLTGRHYPGFKAWQMLWTDTKGHFPDEAHYEIMFLEMQPLLND